ncbi:structural maintenance of chromosome family protein, putative [Bodo saltans]|uniref:Structural maintenance of chromosomes protein n=1 Tax=Bodo saltans TaxID=75058 RepID=A0A0S4IHK8_BODSA|nr:structural maintenance of chromosome family protein, putative [Bodo saltans]|eukprot:CUE66261.1 structural maintenance of chromosome family protein, putative [Bodo saltans]
MTTAKVQHIELYNFKSYSGHVLVGPFKDFSCIVGPNGAGKSNVMDALSFVLGANAATLRGKDASDFICRRAKKKECSVALVLRQPNGTETKLTRAIDSKGTLSMFVDKMNVNEKEFVAVLRKFRLGSRIGSFLVFQHEVDAVAQKKAKELTEMLEVISGSGELKEEYQQKRKVLDAANEALSTASLEKRGAVAEVNQMRLHKKEADRFTEINDKTTQQRRDLALVELFFVENTLAQQKQELERLQEAVNKMQKEFASEEQIRGMKKQQLDKHKIYMEHLREHRTLNVELREKKTNVDRLRISLEHLKKKADDQTVEVKQVKAATTVRSKETQRLEEQLRQQEALLAAFLEQCKQEDVQASHHGTLTADQWTEYRRLKKDADCESISHRQELETVLRQRESLTEGLKQATAALDNHENQTKEMQVVIERNQERIRDLTRKGEEAKVEQEVMKRKETQASVSLVQMQSRLVEQQEELHRVQQQLHELRFVKDDNKMNKRINEALQSLKALYPGIHGKLIDLCEVPQGKYRNAVTVAMGKNLEAVVVDNTDTAMGCIRYLKEQRLVSMTFLPLNALQGKGADDSLRTFGGTTRPIADVVKFDVHLEPAIRYALGQTLVCDGSDEARRIAYGQPDGQRYKVVTVEGTVLLKNGSVQGGLAAIQSRAKKWDEKRYDDLKAHRDRLSQDLANGSEAEAAKARIELKDLQSRIEFSATRINAIAAEIKSYEAKIADLKKELAKQAGGATELNKRITQYRENLAKCESKIAHQQKLVRDVEEKIFAAFQKKVNIPNIAEVEQREVKQTKVRAEKRQQFLLIIQKLKNSIEAETKRIGVRTVQDVEQAFDKTTKEIEQCRKDYEVYSGITSKLEKKQDSLQANITQAKAELDNLDSAIRQSTKSSEEEMRKLAQGKKHLNTVQAACEALRLQRLSLFQRCRMEDTDLPVVDAKDAEAIGAKRARGADGGQQPSSKKRGGGAAGAAEEFFVTLSEAFHTFSESEATRKGVAKEVHVCIDFSSLADALRQQARDQSTFNAYKHRSEATIEQLERELESIAPNLKASTRFGNTETKLGTTSAALDEKREAARKALMEFMRVKEQRVQRFMTTFEKIAQHVDQVYRELTLGTRAHDVHGSAYLTVEDAEEPYNGGVKYHATPPMKRFMTMELLSGGERTMAALALLFAMNAVSPTPFFVLDEVDAALDIGNVVKLGNYLKSHSTQCQFIVVSLKEQLYHLADCLIGVYKDHEHESSGVLTHDLRSYPN